MNTKAKVELPPAGGNLPPLEKPLEEMSEKEREQMRDKALETARRNIAAGKAHTLDIVFDDPEFPEFTGILTLHRPTLDEEREIGIRSAKYLQQTIGVDIKTENIATMFATFDVIVDAMPEWWEAACPHNGEGILVGRAPRKMYDYSVMEFAYKRYAEWLASFRRYGQRKPEPQGDSTDTKGAS